MKLSRLVCTIFIVVFGIFSLVLFSSTGVAGGPRCFMHGVLMPGSKSEKPSVDDMIRLRFDANSKEGCEKMMISYCVYNIQMQGYSPEKMAGSFKADTDADEEFKYTFSSDCGLQSE